jgi:hypothetical protein
LIVPSADASIGATVWRDRGGIDVAIGEERLKYS